MLVTAIYSLLTIQQATVQKEAPTAFVKMILSEDVMKRKQAYPYANSHLIGLIRKKTKPFLLHVIQTDPLMPPRHGPINGDEANYSPKRIALSILAEWQDAELISLFLGYINYYSAGQYGITNFWMPHERYAAVKGLILIGKPSLGPCINEIAKISIHSGMSLGGYESIETYNAALRRRSFLVHTIWSIVGFKEAQRLLVSEAEILSAINPSAANNIAGALEYLKQSEYYRTAMP